VLQVSLGSTDAAALPNLGRWVLAVQSGLRDAALDPTALPADLAIENSVTPTAALASAMSLFFSSSTPSAPAEDKVAKPSSGGEGKKKVDKNDKKKGKEAEVASASASASASKADKKKTADKKAPTDKKGASTDKKGASTEEAAPIAECDFRIGKIVKCWRHPDADKLFCEEIDCGDEGGPRQIASGLVGFYSDPSELEGKFVVVAANLKPRPLVGFTSHGMVLCASSEGKGDVKILEPPAGAVPGERVSFQGHEAPPAAPSRMAKKKILEAVLPGLKVSDTLEATFEGIPFMTSAGPVKVSDSKFAGCNIG
jgi:aminoacyl tRNA synthase complex-interacting multifunctional protein 1